VVVVRFVVGSDDVFDGLCFVARNIIGFEDGAKAV
jgi:hypothetical protein